MKLQPITEWGKTLVENQSSDKAISISTAGAQIGATLSSLNIDRAEFPKQTADAIRELFRPLTVMKDHEGRTPISLSLEKAPEKIRDQILMAKDEVGKVFNELLRALGLKEADAFSGQARPEHITQNSA